MRIVCKSCAVQVLLILAVVAAMPSRGRADQGSAEGAKKCVEQGTTRELGGHTFVPLELVSWPFITTHFGFKVGGGMAKLSGVGIDLSGNPLTEPVTLAALSQGFTLGIGLFDWVALRAKFGGLMISGASLEDILGAGALLNVNAGAGASVRIYKGSRFMLTAGVDFDLLKGKYVTPGLAVAQAINTGDLGAATSNLLIDTSIWTVTPSLAAAIAPLRFLGLQTSFGFDIGGTTIKDTSTTSKGIAWGVGAGLDLQDIHVPIALPVAYQLRAGFGEGAGTEHRIEAGVYYSGRANLDLGLSFQTRLGSQEDKEYLGLLRMNYVW